MPPKTKTKPKLVKLGEYRLHADLEPLLRPAHEATPHPENPKRGDIASIVESMRKNGIYRPVFVQRSTGYIVAGHHTWLAITQGGGEQVPMVMLDCDDDEARRIRLADNRTAELGTYDDDLLLANLRALTDLEGTGYDEDDLDDLAAKLESVGDGSEDESDNDLPDTGELLALADVSWGEPETEVHRHQVWRLGRHVLVIAKLTDEHHMWAHRLTDGVRFMPYPEPYITASDLANTHPLLLVQPNLFLAGHLIDKHKALHPGDDTRVIEELGE